MIFEYDDLKVNYITNDLDDSCPILFLHGWEGSISSFRYFYEHLATKKKCIALDLPPFGESSELTRSFDIKDYADIVIKLLGYLRVKKVDIIAHSFGGRVALEIASGHKNIVNKMLLTGCAGIKNKSLKRYMLVLKYKILKALSRLNLYDKNKLLQLGSHDYKKLNVVMKQTFINIVNYDQKFLLKNISTPTLLVWGSLDKETPFYFTKTFKKHIKDCEVIKFEGCSHFAYLERPKLFLAILLSFFC